MKKYDAKHIEYRGETNGVHSWIAQNGQPYYWHPDWLHIAEDATGTHPKKDIEVDEGETPAEHHAIKAILSHLNEWAHSKLSKN